MGYGADLLSLPHFLSLTISLQLLQQRLGLPEVGGVKAFAEPAIDWCQQLAGFLALAPLLPQAAQAHGSPQFQRLGVLTTGNDKGLVKTSLSLRQVIGRQR